MEHDFVLNAACKGYPLVAEPCAVSQLGARGWNLLDDALAYPVAVLRTITRPLLHEVTGLSTLLPAIGQSPHTST